MRISLWQCLSVCVLLTACSSDPARDAADLVLDDGVVMTMDSVRSTASAVAIRGTRIMAVGSEKDVRPWIGPDTRVVDLQGRTVLPGFSETHIHMSTLGFEKNTAVNMTPARNVADVQKLLSDRLAQLRKEGRLGGWTYPTTGRKGPWLFGLGWTQDRLENSRMADRHDLDQVSRDVPISLTRIYRGIAVNTKVFELLGYHFDDPSTWPDWFRHDPPDFGPGEIIMRDSTGLPNGIFLGEKAARLVSSAVPDMSLDQKVESLLGGMHYLSSLGFTALIEPGSRIGRVTRVYQEAYNRNGRKLPVRAVVYDGWYRSHDPLGIGDPEKIKEHLDGMGINDVGDDYFRIRGAKSSMDGGMGSRSAAVSVPYLPVPEDPLGAHNRGALREPSFDRALAQYRALADHGWDINVHAIGDRAIRRVMDLYEVLLDSLQKARPDVDRRWSIIHLYQPDEPGTSVVKEMAKYHIVAAINPANLWYEGASFLRNVGPERMARHTPYRTLLNAGVVMACGSDYPNNPPDPWAGIYQMLTRKIQHVDGVYGKDQTIPLDDALACFTSNGAYLMYDENKRGSLTPGRYADLTIIDADLPKATPDEILHMADNVVLTMVGGEVTYRKEGFDF